MFKKDPKFLKKRYRNQKGLITQAIVIAKVKVKVKVKATVANMKHF